MIDALRENRVRSDKCVGEVHISLFDLEQQRLKLRFQDEADKTQIIDLASVGQNEFNDLLNDVDFFELLFDFTGSDFDPLGIFGPPREFILALGEDEKTVTLDENGAVRFDNLEHLNKLSADDLLTLRLFQSNDAVNVLWEWAFLANIYFVDETGEKVNHDASFSHPNPVVKIGTGSSLNDIQLSDISISGDTASVTINGRIYCDIADISEDPNADITEVTLLVPRSNTTGGYERITVAVTNVSNPVNVLSAHASIHTDAALGLLVNEIEEDGYLNAVLFAMTADHGQHQFSDFDENDDINKDLKVTVQNRVVLVEELEPLLESPESKGGLEMKLFRGGNINTTDIVYSPNGGLGQFYIRTSNNRNFLDENRTWHEPPKTDDIKRVASLLYREAVGHDVIRYDSSHIILIEDDPATPDINEELRYAELAPVSGVNDTTNGAFGSPPAIFVKYCDSSMGGCSVPIDNAFIQDFKWVENVYLKCDLRIRSVQDETQRAAFIDSFKNEYSIKRKECAAAIVEITGLGDWVISGYSDSSAFQSIAITDTNDPGSSLRNMLDAIPEDRTEEKKDLIKQLSSILNHSILDDYTDIKLGTIDQFLLARQVVVPDLDWPAFKERLDEMNHKNATGSRTGDIVTMMDGRKGYLTVNYEKESYPGWHGGPTVSESYVPLIFSMPGDSFVDLNGNLIGTPPELVTGFNAGVEKAGIKADGYLRNWHLTPILREIITQFRDD